MEIRKIKINQNDGFSYIEVVVSTVIFVMCVVFILQTLSAYYKQIVRLYVYFLGLGLVHEKVEEFRAMNYTEIEFNEGIDRHYFIIERRWVVKRLRDSIEICVSSYTNNGIKLYQFCINRIENE